MRTKKREDTYHDKSESKLQTFAEKMYETPEDIYSEEMNVDPQPTNH